MEIRPLCSRGGLGGTDEAAESRRAPRSAGRRAERRQLAADGRFGCLCGGESAKPLPSRAAKLTGQGNRTFRALREEGNVPVWAPPSP